MIKRALITVIVSLTLTTQGATEERWVEADGEAYGANLTPEQGYTQALEQARAEAIRVAAGVRIQSETLLIQSETQGKQDGDYSSLFSEINSLISYGQIVQEKYTKSMEHYQPDPDPNFQLNVTLNRNTFIAERDTMIITLRSNQDCFVTLFNILPTDSVYVLLPNDRIPTFSLKAGVGRVVPEPAWGTSIRLFSLPGQDQHGEAILAIATKRHIDFMAGQPLSGVILGRQAALTELTRWLVNIPIEERVTSFMQYQVRKN